MENFHEFIKKVGAKLKCPVCHEHYEVDNLKIKAVFRTQALIQAHCARQHPPAMSLITVNKKDVISKVQPIHYDDVIDLHKALSSFQGNFEKLFQDLGNNKN